MRPLCLILCVSFTLLSPAWAMRVESAQQSAGAEQLTHALSAAGAEERGDWMKLTAGGEKPGNERVGVKLNGRGVPGAGPADRSGERLNPEAGQMKLPRTEPTNQLPFQTPPLALQVQSQYNQRHVQPEPDQKGRDPEILAQHTAQDQSPKHRVTGVNGDLQQGVALLGSKPSQVYPPLGISSRNRSRTSSIMLQNISIINKNLPATGMEEASLSFAHDPKHNPLAERQDLTALGVSR